MFSLNYKEIYPYIVACYPTSDTKCTMFGSLSTSYHQLYRVSIFETPFGLLIRFIYNLTHLTAITHNYFLRCVTFTQLCSQELWPLDHRGGPTLPIIDKNYTFFLPRMLFN
jgi:hypothetical protein